ncbi:hypothetical protein [Sinomicrobium sp.]
MKKITLLLKNGIIAMMVMAAIPTAAQIVAPQPAATISTPADLNVGTLNNNTGSVTVLDQAVLFYNPATDGPSLTLTASLDDGNGNTFTSYEWYNIATDGSSETENVITGETAATLTRTGLAPGYHKFRVYGLVNDGSVICQSEEFQDIIIFVLPPLTVETAFDDKGNPLGYCLADLASMTPIELSVSGVTADYSANANGYTNPLGEAFAVTYQWFAVKDGDTDNPIDLETTTENYSVDLDQAGSYTFYVEVKYVDSIKEDNDDRDYLTYTNQVENTDGTPLTIVVTPIPGAPTISISSVD